MNKSKKKWVAIIYFFALGAVGVGIYPTLTCINALRTDFSLSESQDPAVLALKETLTNTPTNNEINDLVTPICREREPFQNALPWFALAGLLAIGGIIPLLGKREDDDDLPAETRSAPRKRQVLNTKQMAAINVEGAFEIDIGEDSHAGLDSDKNTLMSIVEKQRAITPSDGVHDPRHQFFVPKGFEESAIIFVDPELKKETPTRFFDLDRALIVAQTMMLANPKGVQVKILPGVYQSSIEVPPNVVIVNQKMPRFSGSREGLLWISKQELDDPNRVTILADPEKPYGVKFIRGAHHGIFGCHIVGRGTKGQCGILIERSETVEIVNCVIEQFSNSGIRIERAGSEFPKIRVKINGSMIHKNQALQGGGVFVLESSVAFESCLLKGNTAQQGGGLFVAGVRRPIVLEAVRFEKNISSDPKKEQIGPDRDLKSWEKQRGLGGAIFGVRTKLRAKDLECIENLAEVGGGAIALFSSGMSIHNDEHKSRIERNKSQLGGGIFIVGTPEKDALLKAEHTTMSSNICKAFGGAICIIGKAIVQAEECKIEKNKSVNASGGGVSCHLGGSIDINGGSLSENHAKFNGGGIASLNGRVRIRGQAKVTHNRAQGSGGGVFAISDPSPLTEALIKQNALQLPLKIIVGDANIRYNKCKKVGSGLRVGNLGKVATMPLDIQIDGKASIRSNESMDGDASDIFGTWAGEILSESVSDYRKKQLS